MAMTLTPALSRRYEFTLHTKEGTVPSISYAYPIYVQPRPDWREFAFLLAGVGADHFTLVADAGLPRHLIEQVYDRVSTLGIPCLLLTVDVSEQAKTMETALSLAFRARAQGGGTHRSCLLALGGGLVGNLTGLAASLLVRGIKFIHLPTTLLAATDSVLSCKQGVNGVIAPHLLVKNLVGTFKAPEFVLVNLAFWETLAPDEIRAGLCELIKNVVAIHPQRFKPALALLHPEARYTLEQEQTIFDWCWQAKQEVMHNDAHEQGPALILEYGHTVGHALETLTGLRHGFAVGLGMLVSAHLSHMRGYLSAEEVQMHYRLLLRNGAPTTLPTAVSIEELLSLMHQDNKIGSLPPRQGFHAMVLLQHLGQPVLEQGLPLTYVSEDEVRAGMAAIQPEMPAGSAVSHCSHC